MVMDTPEELKAKGSITREDIGRLLAFIGEPGKKRKEKTAAVEQLSKRNSQGHDISVTLDSYPEY